MGSPAGALGALFILRPATCESSNVRFRRQLIFLPSLVRYMFAIRSLLRNPSIPRINVLCPPQCRRPLKTLAKGQLKADTPVAKKLAATGLWSYGRWGKKDGKRPSGDKSRVHIVSEQLCGSYSSSPLLVLLPLPSFIDEGYC